ncbi:MAG: sulfite exporter TauE/SafE family protein [Bacteroidetes bacterium]|nr:MAG: sulfite exporter TauE/SafE family protein [Bacteroidota bacterium]
MTFTTILILMIIGLAAGILSGFAGVGGGVIIIPALIFLLGMTQFEAQGTSLALMIPPIGILAAMNYYKEGYINWRYAAILAIFFFVGGYIGSKMALTIPQNIVKKGFAVFIIVIGVKMLVGK